MRTFEFRDGKSNKFWNIDLQGKGFTVRFGKLGAAGQTQVKQFADEAAAKKECGKLVAEKLKKGYVETTAAGQPAAPAPAAPLAPAPAPPPAPPPETVAAAAGKRTFEFSDASSHKFWNIELAGESLTITYGRIGTAGQAQVKNFPDQARARKEHDKLVYEKVSKGGYEETTPVVTVPASLRESLELALVENPDDLASHMAYADYLAEHGDPLGDFIRVQLALEDASKPPEARKKLQQQEEKLRNAHQRAWLGELAPYLLGENKGPGSSDWQHLQITYTFARGWLDTIEANNYPLEFTRALAKAPQVRLLRRLVLRGASPYEPPEAYQPSDDVPVRTGNPQLYPLARSPHLTNVREFVLGEIIPPEVDLNPGDYFNCCTQGEGVVGVVKRMPKLGELHLLAHNIDAEQLFSLRTLHQLRVLLVYHESSYPLARLAKNPSLGKLTHLLCHPHCLTKEEAYIRLPAVRAVLRSTDLPSLTHLRLRLTDISDAGAREIVASGILKRLKVLDLQHGCISDEGARLLAACGDLKNLERLDLTQNCLTEAGIQALRAAGANLVADDQWQQTGDEGADREYLFMAGDME